MFVNHILLVEDDTNILQINKSFLENEGYTVYCAETLAEAEARLEECNPDLVLLDVMLPDGDGLSFCKTLRQYTQSPVIFLTARDENECIIKGLENGGDDYIVKPYDLNVLKARIEVQLRKKGNSSDKPKISLPGLSIDLFTGTAILDGRECVLPQRELQILYLLASRVGSRLSYHEIYQQIYGCDVEDSKNTVRVNISRLKKHIGLDDESTYELCWTSDGEYVLRRVIF